MMTAQQWILAGGFGLLLVVLIWKRLNLGFSAPTNILNKEKWAFGQTTGNKEIQSDCVQVYENDAGIMAVLADGIGKENTGKVAAQIAADAVLDAFEPYHVLNNPEYLFRTAFFDANIRIQQTIGERRGGASMAAVFINQAQMCYGLAGNIRIALFRNRELIPISKGQTLNVLAKEAYQEGLLSKSETIWSMEEKRIWNHLGKEGFREIEVSSPPIALKPGDIIFMASQGIFEELSWAEIEEVLLQEMTIKEMADTIVMEAERKTSPDKENGSVLLLVWEDTDEKNQF